MKARVHVFGALFGCACAIGFTLTPFLAGADAPPGRIAPKATATTTDNNSGSIKPLKRHMHRGNVSKYDDGCGD